MIFLLDPVPDTDMSGSTEERFHHGGLASAVQPAWGRGSERLWRPGWEPLGTLWLCQDGY